MLIISSGVTLFESGCKTSTLIDFSQLFAYFFRVK